MTEVPPQRNGETITQIDDEVLARCLDDGWYYRLVLSEQHCKRIGLVTDSVLLQPPTKQGKLP